MKNLKELLLSNDPVSELRKLDESGSLAAFEPTLAALRMSMPKGVRHKDVLEHSFQVLQNAIDREDEVDVILRAAALFHDIGKPDTRRFGTRNTVTFDNHEYVGAKITNKVLPRHGFSKSETVIISKLVALHMRSHGFQENPWTDSGIRRLITDAVTDKDMDRLVKVFYADNTTKHKSKLNRIHSSLDCLVSEVARVRKEDARKALRPALDGNDVMELLGISPGPELGQIMRFLNTDEGIVLSKEEATALVLEKYS